MELSTLKDNMKRVIRLELLLQENNKMELILK
jgi:hypothetical protein